MTPNAAQFTRIAVSVLATLLVGLPAAWGGFALWYRLPGGEARKALGALVWAAFSVLVMAAVWEGWPAIGAAVFALAFAGLLAWWTRLRPTNEGPWADDVAHATTGTVEGNRVTLHDVRNFDWRSRSDYTPRWETRGYALDRLRSVDMIMSHWHFRAIAHMLISFGFDDGSHVAFSVEVRRRKTQAFSEIGGFFKEFELSIIAADERDVIRVRTNVRGEDAYLYQLRMPPPAMRSLFLGYVDEANRLAATPRFYNTITVNCTTLVYHMMKRIVGYLPLDHRLLLSGYLPAYVHDVGGLNPHYSTQELKSLGRITERARRSDRSPEFSQDIRRGLPGVESPVAEMSGYNSNKDRELL